MKTENAMLIDIDFLKSKNACEGIIDWFEENIKKPINHVDLIKMLLTGMEIEKIRWCNWLLTSLFNKKQNIKYAIFSAELVLHIYEAKYPDDKRPRHAIDAAKKCLVAVGADIHDAASDAARATAHASYAAAHASYDASYVYDAAARAAYAASYSAYSAYAAYAAYTASYSAAAHASYAAADAADAAYTAASKKAFIKIINYGLELLESDQ